LVSVSSLGFEDYKEMFQSRTVFKGLTLATLLVLGGETAVGQESPSAWPPPPPAAAAPTLGPANFQPSPPPSPYNSAWPAPGQDGRTYGGGRQDSLVTPLPSPATPALSVVPDTPPVEQVITSTWYFRQESFYWNERMDGHDYVNERGPLSTLGYLRRNRFERFRMELFGGSVAYDGGAQYSDGRYEAYHQSNGTNYLGVRAEYDLLIEPACWSRVRLFAGVGTRFWIRDLNDSITPSGNAVSGYQEDWWTFYPYVGLETKEPDEPGWKFFGSVRFGLTPLTYQSVSYPVPDYYCVNTALYPRCGVTGKMELGVRFQHVTVAAYLEGFTWGESAEVRGSLQPASRMLTLGGQLGYTF
jgi:hypothetical protein